ncbi:hypothetical protein ER308_17635 [Egibacter rhizosphaerae]|uniref:Uncharacterized protein n=1 Tax=Egibacter rhizosphaerae TaxID=1670831 RepID=A0A411YJ83_9ACTN|nr:hypothetical protein [Egibacter rhizosphaerae]QBI21211.1 hypothetical protein ER308_17635 [Egibacter rhizosphaerae]
MSGPLGVVALLLAQTAVGALVVLWGIGAWGATRRTFIHLTGIAATLAAWGAWAAGRAGVAEAASGVGAADGFAAAVPGALLASAGVLTLWQGALITGENAVSRLLGYVATLGAAAALGITAASRGDRILLAVTEAGLGALFLGSTLLGLLLGHWYLFERRLTNRYMIRSARWYAAGVVAGAAAAGLSSLNPAPPLAGFSPFLAVPGFSLWLAGGLVLVCALIAAFVLKLAHEGGRSIQAATGLMYLAVIMAFSAELSTKFRFF